MLNNTIYEGKLTIVTGSSRGVGKIISEHILANGGYVAGFSRGESAIDNLNYEHFKVDIGDPSSVITAFRRLRTLEKTVDIVVNNAAILTSQYAMIMPIAQAQAMLNVNLLGPFLVSREASKMMRTKKWGRIIHIGSMAASLEPIGDSIYAASKSGLLSLSSVMAKELAPLNITCNTLAISAIKTDMLDQLPQNKVNAVVGQLPIPRYAEPEDILNVIDFFASERSSYITAQTLYLGGVN